MLEEDDEGRFGGGDGLREQAGCRYELFPLDWGIGHRQEGKKGVKIRPTIDASCTVC